MAILQLAIGPKKISAQVESIFVGPYTVILCDVINRVKLDQLFVLKLGVCQNPQKKNCVNIILPFAIFSHPSPPPNEI